MTAQEDLTGMPTPKQDERTPTLRLTHLDGDPTMLVDADDLDKGPIVEVWVTPHQNEERAKQVAADIVRACNSYDKLREALEKVMIGGNHLGLIIGADHPPYTASYEDARAHYSGAIETYEAWCCWKTIMAARAALDAVNKEEKS